MTAPGFRCAVSNSLGEEAELYATSGVPEYWVVNLVGHTIEVHREPVAGRYQQIETYPKGTQLRLLAFPDVVVAVDDVIK